MSPTTPGEFYAPLGRFTAFDLGLGLGSGHEFIFGPLIGWEVHFGIGEDFFLL